MNNPSKVFKCGPIRASLWANSRVVEGHMVQILSVTLDRVYKNGEEWKYSRSFSIEDLPKIVFAVEEIYKSLRLETKEITADVNNELPENSVGEDSKGINEDI